MWWLVVVNTMELNQRSCSAAWPVNGATEGGQDYPKKKKDKTLVPSKVSSWQPITESVYSPCGTQQSTLCSPQLSDRKSPPLKKWSLLILFLYTASVLVFQFNLLSISCPRMDTCSHSFPPEVSNGSKKIRFKDIHILWLILYYKQQFNRVMSKNIPEVLNCRSHKWPNIVIVVSKIIYSLGWYY